MPNKKLLRAGNAPGPRRALAHGQHDRTHIRIADQHGEDRERPRAILMFNSGEQQCIDIIASVKRNAASIGHPAILLAIRRWEAIVRQYHHLALRSNGYALYKLAKLHLKRVGAAMVEGAIDRALNKETAFDNLGLVGVGVMPYWVLRRAYDLLDSKEIKVMRNRDMILRKLKVRLQAFGCDDVIAFLKSDQGGRFIQRRGMWAAMLHAYMGWQFDVEPQTIKSYLSRVRHKPNKTDFDVHNRLQDIFLRPEHIPLPVVLLNTDQSVD